MMNSKTNADTTMKIMSKATITCSQGDKLSHASPANTSPVAFTAAIITGTTIGKNSMGSIISLALVFTARAEKRVPTEAKPIVAKSIAGVKSR